MGICFHKSPKTIKAETISNLKTRHGLDPQTTLNLKEESHVADQDNIKDMKEWEG
jgi:hypothetical protein